jgi:Prokaryotic dksA/traR C4-type zinc finger
MYKTNGAGISLAVRPHEFDGSGENRGHLAIRETVTLKNRHLEVPFAEGRPKMTSDEKECERCGEPIPARRLEVLPDTRLCIACSEAIGGDYKTFVIPENTGKPGSLKKNYGSWKVTRKLRRITPISKK